MVTADKTQRLNEWALCCTRSRRRYRSCRRKRGGKDTKAGDVTWKVLPVWVNSGNTLCSQQMIHTEFNFFKCEPSYRKRTQCYSPVGEPGFNKLPTQLLPAQRDKAWRIYLRRGSMDDIANGRMSLNIIVITTWMFSNARATMMCRSVTLPKIELVTERAPRRCRRDRPIYNCTDEECDQYTTELVAGKMQVGRISAARPVPKTYLCAIQSAAHLPRREGGIVDLAVLLALWRLRQQAALFRGGDARAFSRATNCGPNLLCLDLSLI